ncbi:serine hydrolase [Limnospira platensis CENA597]|uniref:serine hydrolase n=1 Tax=Limnospira platensis TaxID=118562 RepID=UPI003D6E1707
MDQISSTEEIKSGYNVQSPPNWDSKAQLQAIVNETVAIAKNKGFPTEALSITLVDVSDSGKHYKAGYNNQILRFPASVAKLFWLVGFFDQVERGSIRDESKFHDHLNQMIRISDNESASEIVDAITQSTSGETLTGKDLTTWLNQRSQINKFFEQAGYAGIILSMKNYPIDNSQETPTGRDLQLKQTPDLVNGNQITTDQAARLMYEIYTQQAVSPIASTKMAYLLTRDLNPETFEESDRQFIEGFLGQSLPTDIYFGSKVGYTSYSRQEVIFVRTLDDQTIYILAIFANDPAYSQDQDIFPQMSRHIFDRLHRTPQNLTPKEVSVFNPTTEPSQLKNPPLN